MVSVSETVIGFTFLTATLLVGVLRRSPVSNVQPNSAALNGPKGSLATVGGAVCVRRPRTNLVMTLRDQESSCNDGTTAAR